MNSHLLLHTWVCLALLGPEPTSSPTIEDLDLLGDEEPYLISGYRAWPK